MDSIRDAVRSRYARTAIQMQETGSCCDSACCGGTHAISGPIHEADYVTSELAEVGLTTGASLGCGNPTALAQLHPGEIVLDLGSGAGLDVLLSARRVAPGGRALAGLRRAWGDSVAVAFLAGRGAALRDLLFALRYEADADAADHVTIALPRGHPAADDMRATGYDFANAEDSAFIYGLKLKPPQND